MSEPNDARTGDDASRANKTGFTEVYLRTMPPRVDTWFFGVHSFIKRHNLRHWLTVAEARKLLKGEKLGIDAANMLDA
jgi:hypothetical protein